MVSLRGRACPPCVLAVASLGSLESIEGDLFLEELRSLEELDLASLLELGGDFRMRRNQALPQCLAEYYLSRLQTQGAFDGAVQVEDNRPDCTCTEVDGQPEVECD